MDPNNEPINFQQNMNGVKEDNFQQNNNPQEPNMDMGFLPPPNMAANQTVNNQPLVQADPIIQQPPSIEIEMQNVQNNQVIPQQSVYVEPEEKSITFTAGDAFALPWKTIGYFFSKGLSCVGALDAIPVVFFSFLMGLCSLVFVGCGIVVGINTGFIIRDAVSSLDSDATASEIIEQILGGGNSGSTALGFLEAYFDQYNVYGLTGMGLALVVFLILAFVLTILTIIFSYPHYIQLARSTELIEAGRREKSSCNPFYYCFWYPKGFCGHVAMFFLMTILLFFLEILKEVIVGVLQAIPVVGTIIGLILEFVLRFYLNTIFYTLAIFVIRGKSFKGFEYIFDNFGISFLFGLSVWLMNFVPFLNLFKTLIGIVAGTILILRSGYLKASKCDID